MRWQVDCPSVKDVLAEYTLWSHQQKISEEIMSDKQRGRCEADEICSLQIKKGGRQMRSIFKMPSDDMAGDAKRRVPIHYYTRRTGYVNR